MIPPCHTPKRIGAFTLVELLTVIAIIAVLMGLLFPAIGGVREMARKAQAKNDVVGIVNAVKAYYTEYGKYPSQASNPTPENDASDYRTDNDADRQELFETLSGSDEHDLNPRQIPFLEIPVAKNTETPKSGRKGGEGGDDYVFYDPWGNPYMVRFDNGYNNKLETPYGDTIDSGAIAWSIGKDKTEDSNTDGDDVVSWQ